MGNRATVSLSSMKLRGEKERIVEEEVERKR
jgi:hypothetical protein